MEGRLVLNEYLGFGSYQLPQNHKRFDSQSALSVSTLVESQSGAEH